MRGAARDRRDWGYGAYGLREDIIFQSTAVTCHEFVQVLKMSGYFMLVIILGLI